jgi:GT2 family glycosyltransferase
MKSLQPTISIIVVSYNTRDLLRGCLRSLAPEVAAVGVEVIVVDNGSTDGSADMVRADYPDVQLLCLGENRGFGAANNCAAALSAAEYLLLLNSDTIVHPHALSALLTFVAAHPDAGAVGARLLNTDGSLQKSCWRFPTPGLELAECLGLLRLFRRPSNYLSRDYTHPRRVDFAVGACLLIRRVAFQQVGGFDEAFFLYAEETDLCHRFHDAGWQVYYTPDSVVTHLGGGSATAGETQFRQFNTGKDRYFRKHHGRRGLIVYHVVAIVRSILRLVLWTLLSQVWRGRHATWREGILRNRRAFRWHWRALAVHEQGSLTRKATS